MALPRFLIFYDEIDWERVERQVHPPFTLGSDGVVRRGVEVDGAMFSVVPDEDPGVAAIQAQVAQYLYAPPYRFLDRPMTYNTIFHAARGWGKAKAVEEAQALHDQIQDLMRKPEPAPWAGKTVKVGFLPPPSMNPAHIVPYRTISVEDLLGASSIDPIQEAVAVAEERRLASLAAFRGAVRAGVLPSV